MQRSGVRSPRRPPNFPPPDLSIGLAGQEGLRYMVLSDVDIKRYIQQGKIKIDPSLPPEQYGSCSVDFRLGREFNVFEHSRHALIDRRNKAGLDGIMRSIIVADDD